MYTINIFGFSLYDLLYFFTIYSFGGWLCEIAYAYKNQKKFVNRGFLNGPFCPIYGFGCLILIVFLNYVKHNLLLLFIGSVFLTSLLEYITAIILEYAFKSTWWDYSDDPFNIKGRICLVFSLIWGALGLIVVKFIHPVVDSIVSSIPLYIGSVFFYVILCYFIVDLTITVSSLIKLKNIINQLNDLYLEIKSKIKMPNVDSNIKDLKQHYEKIISKLTKPQMRILKAFPNLKSDNFALIIKDIQSRISSFIQK